MGLFPRYLMIITVCCTVAVSVVFFVTYRSLLKDRLEGEAAHGPALHFVKNLTSGLSKWEVVEQGINEDQGTIKGKSSRNH